MEASSRKGAGSVERSGTVPVPFLVLEKVPLLAMSAATAMLTYLAQARGGAVVSLARVGASERLLNALASFAHYLGKIVWPAGLSAIYPRPDAGVLASRAAWAGLLLLAVTLAAFAWRRRRPYLLAGWLWYLVALLPVIGLVQVGYQSMADRYTYLPAAGLTTALAWAAADAAGTPRRRKLLAGACLLVLAALAAATRIQVGWWRDDAALFGHARDVLPADWLARHPTGPSQASARLSAAAYGLASRGNLAEAEAVFRDALDFRPDDAAALAGLGEVLARRGRGGEARDAFRAARSLEPDNADLLARIGAVQLSTGDLSGAEESLARAVGLKPGDAEALCNLGLALAGQGRHAEALARYDAAAAIDPRRAAIRNNAGNALMRLGRPGEAIPRYHGALELDRSNAEAHNNLGAALASLGRYDAAAAEFREALALRPGYTSALGNLERISHDGRGRDMNPSAGGPVRGPGGTGP